MNDQHAAARAVVPHLPNFEALLRMKNKSTNMLLLFKKGASQTQTAGSRTKNLMV